MIALCHDHHAAADSYTKEQLREFKRNPFVTEQRQKQLGWFTKKAMIKIGYGFYAPPLIIVEIEDQSILEMRYNQDGYISLSVNLFDYDKLVAKISDNDLEVSSDIYDLEVRPKQNMIKVFTQNIMNASNFQLEWKNISELQYAIMLEKERLETYKLKLNNLEERINTDDVFHRCSAIDNINEYYKYCSDKTSMEIRNNRLSMAQQKAMDTEKVIRIVEITGRFAYKDKWIELTKDGIRDMNENVVNCSVSDIGPGCAVANLGYWVVGKGI